MWYYTWKEAKVAGLDSVKETLFPLTVSTCPQQIPVLVYVHATLCTFSYCILWLILKYPSKWETFSFVDCFKNIMNGPVKNSLTVYCFQCSDWAHTKLLGIILLKVPSLNSTLSHGMWGGRGSLKMLNGIMILLYLEMNLCCIVISYLGMLTCIRTYIQTYIHTYIYVQLYFKKKFNCVCIH